MSLCVGVVVGGDSIGAVAAGKDTPVSTPCRASVPALLVIAPGVGVLVGPQAERFAGSGTGAVFRDFAGRVGDPVPVVGSDGSARLGADLVAMTVGGVLRGCAAGSQLAHLTIAHPTGWGPYEVSVLRSALTCTEAEGVPTSLVSNPIAAVIAAVTAGMMRVSETVIVADISGQGTEVALVTGAENHVGRLVATSQTDDLGSAALDRALARHVLGQVSGQLPAADLQDPANRGIVRDVVAAARRARQDLVRHTSTVVDVRLPERSVPVRIVRAEFEALAREPIHAGLSAIAHLVTQAQDNGIKVNAIMLTGEVAKTPLLTELISAQWPTRVVIPPSPEWATASGTARIAVGRSQPRSIIPLSPARPDASNPARPQPAQNRADRPQSSQHNPKASVTSSQAMSAVSRVAPTASERKWTLRWGAIQLTAALVSDPHRRASDHRDRGPSLRPHAVPRHS
ncbi:MAG: Hsp70 family protein [Pseudonocardiaceae bacterium]